MKMVRKRRLIRIWKNHLKPVPVSRK